MSLTLNLGVASINYVDEHGVSTGDVANFNEAKYGVLQHFYNHNQQAVADALADSVASALENVLLGAPVEGIDPYAGATSEIEVMMKDWLALGEMDRLGLPGIPTMAAQKGVNKRRKLKKGPPRPSFIDSGIMQASYKAWVE